METAREAARLQEIARNTRKLILGTLAEAGSGHPGGSLSAVELLVTLYFYKMKHDPKNPHWPEGTDSSSARGTRRPFSTRYSPRRVTSPPRSCSPSASSAPSCRATRTSGFPGVEMPAGSEGIGLSVGVGEALAAKIDGKGYRTYVLMGDGEQQEGEVWEAAMSASKFKLDNLTAIIDRNGIQQDGLTEQIMPLEPLASKWRAFNWNVIEVDGYDYLQLIDAFDNAEMTKHSPTIIIAHTVKGKGISFMEWSPAYHGTPPSKDKMTDIYNELK